MKTARIRELNEQLRCEGIGGCIVITRGIGKLRQLEPGGTMPRNSFLRGLKSMTTSPGLFRFPMASPSVRQGRSWRGPSNSVPTSSAACGPCVGSGKSTAALYRLPMKIARSRSWGAP